MRMFAKPEIMLSEIASMVTAEKNRREDRATVSEFFNGRPPLTQEEAEEINLTVNVNNLFGYTEIADAKAQMLGLYVKPTEVFKFEIDAMPKDRVYERTKWEAESSLGMNLLIKDSGLFKPKYESACGDASLHGEAVFMMPNRSFWCPDFVPLSKMLIPDDAPTDLTKQTHWCVEGELTLADLHDYAKGDFDGWRVANVKRILSRIYKDVQSVESAEWDSNNAEDMEYKRQQNSGADSGGRRRPTVRVYYFYQVRADKKGNPIDLTILLHDNETADDHAAKAEDKLLFDRECFYPNVGDCLHPCFMDCTLGGESKWHRVLGTGTLNYSLAHATEILCDRVMQGTMEGMINLWQAKDSITREEVQQVLARHNGVVPENISLIQQRFTPDFGGALSLIQFFRQQGARNSRRVSENSGDSKLLEVQALQQQGQAEEVMSTRAANWYDHLDRLGKIMASRLTNPFIQPWQAGYSDVKKFQARLERLGVSLYHLQPHNIRVTAVRVLGDGSAQKERTAALWLSQNRAMFPPESQQRITRMATAAMTGSHRIAEELVPIQDKPDTSQILRADSESNTCIVQGRTPPVNDDDVDDIHFPLHLEAMIVIVQRAAQFQQTTFTPQDYVAFRALGGHCVAHVNKIQSMIGVGKGDQNKAKARQWMQALNEVVSVGEKMAHNLRQKQENQDQKPDPVDVAKLQIAAQQLELSKEKLMFSVHKFERQQMHRESEASFDRMLKLESNHREDRLAISDIGTNDVKTAIEVSASGREKSNAA